MTSLSYAAQCAIGIGRRIEQEHAPLEHVGYIRAGKNIVPLYRGGSGKYLIGTLYAYRVLEEKPDRVYQADELYQCTGHGAHVRAEVDRDGWPSWCDWNGSSGSWGRRPMEEIK